MKDAVISNKFSKTFVQIGKVMPKFTSKGDEYEKNRNRQQISWR